MYFGHNCEIEGPFEPCHFCHSCHFCLLTADWLLTLLEFRCYLQSLSEGAALTEVVRELFSSEPTGYGMVQPGWSVQPTTPVDQQWPPSLLHDWHWCKHWNGSKIDQVLASLRKELSIKVKSGVIQYDFKRRTPPPFSSVAPLRPAGTASRPRRDNLWRNSTIYSTSTLSLNSSGASLVVFMLIFRAYPKMGHLGYFGGTKNGTSGARIKILRPLFNTNTPPKTPI